MFDYIHMTYKYSNYTITIGIMHWPKHMIWYRISPWWWSYLWVLLSFHWQPLLEHSPWVLLAV